MKGIFMSWNEAHELTRKLYEKIKAKKYRPDVIIAVARGGFIIARELADYLRVKEMETVNVDHWGISATKSGKAEIRKRVGLDITGKKVLVVDDISDTGESLEVTLNYLKQLGPAKIKTASLHMREGSIFKPDFYVSKVKHKRWILYPWEIWEDLTIFILEITDGEWKSANQISKELKEKRDLKFSGKKLLEFLNDMRYWKFLKHRKERNRILWKAAGRLSDEGLLSDD